MSVETFPAHRSPAGPEVAAPASVRRAPWQRVRLSAALVAGSLSVMLLVSLWLRTRGIHFYYWVDEGLSVGIASHPLAHIPNVLRQDGSPPLYYLLLHVWMSLFGRGEVATHALSLLFGLLIIPVAYWAGASLWDRRAGLGAAVLAAGAPYLTTYAQETRMYAMVSLLSLLVAASFVHVYVRRHRRYLPLFAAALAATLYSHNWGLFMGVGAAAALVLCVLSAEPSERRGLWRDGLIGFGAAAVLYLPWLPTLVYQARHTGAPWSMPPVFWSLTESFYALTGGRGAAMALLLAGGAGLAALSRRGTLRGRWSVPRLPLAVESLLVLALGTLLLAWLYSKISPAWASRYLAVIVGPLLLAFGLGLSRGGRLALVAIVFVVGFWVLDPVSHNTNAKSNVASVAALSRHHLGSNPLVISMQPEDVATIFYYLPEVRRFGTPVGMIPDPGVFDWRNALAKLRRSSVQGVLEPMLRQVAPGQRVLLVSPSNLGKEPLWLELINRYTTRWQDALNHSPAFRRLAEYNRGQFSAGTGVVGYLYQRR